MREKMKKEKEEVCCRHVIINVSSGSDPFTSVSVRRKRRKNVKKRNERNGRKRRLLGRWVPHSFFPHLPALTSRVSRRRIV